MQSKVNNLKERCEREGESMLDGLGPKVLAVAVVGLTIVLIGVGIYTVFFNVQNEDKSLVIRSVGDVDASPESFVGQRITVQGYYYQGDRTQGYGYITDVPVQLPIIEGSLNDVNFLVMNFTGFNITFGQGVLYYFTGTFQASLDPYTDLTSYTLTLKAIEQP